MNLASAKSVGWALLPVRSSPLTKQTGRSAHPTTESPNDSAASFTFVIAAVVAACVLVNNTTARAAGCVAQETSGIASIKNEASNFIERRSNVSRTCLKQAGPPPNRKPCRWMMTADQSANSMRGHHPSSSMPLSEDARRGRCGGRRVTASIIHSSSGRERPRL